jgi:hypothetical protein
MSASDSGQNKVQEATQNGDATMNNTNDNGKDIIKEEQRALKQDYETYTNSVGDVLSNLGRLEIWSVMAEWLGRRTLNQRVVGSNPGRIP